MYLNKYRISSQLLKLYKLDFVQGNRKEKTALIFQYVILLNVQFDTQLGKT